MAWIYKPVFIRDLEDTEDVELYLQRLINDIKNNVFLTVKDEDEFKSTINNTQSPAYNDLSSTFSNIQSLLNNLITNDYYYEFGLACYYLNQQLPLFYQKLNQAKISKYHDGIIEEAFDREHYQLAKFFLDNSSDLARKQLITYYLKKQNLSENKKYSSAYFLLNEYDYFNLVNVEKKHQVFDKLLLNHHKYNEVIDLIINNQKKNTNQDLFNLEFIGKLIFKASDNQFQIDLEKIIDNQLYFNLDTFYETRHKDSPIHNLGRAFQFQFHFLSPSAQEKMLKKIINDHHKYQPLFLEAIIDMAPHLAINLDLNSLTFKSTSHPLYKVIAAFLKDIGINQINSENLQDLDNILKNYKNISLDHGENILTFALKKLPRSSDRQKKYWPVIELIIKNNENLLNEKNLAGQYPLDLVSFKSKQLLLAAGAKKYTPSFFNKLVKLVDSFSTQKVPELSNNLNFTGLDKIYFNFNKNIDQIYQLMENDSFIDFPDQVKMKIEQNILLAKKCLSLIKKEKNLNLYEEAMILEKNIGKYTIKVLENYQRAQNLPQSTEHQLRTVEQINLIGEQINLIYQNIIEAIQNDLAKDITINQQLIKKTNHLTVK